MTAMCPSCGFDLTADQPVIINDFSMLSAMSPLYFKGNQIKLTFAERAVVWSMMKAFPRPVSHELLLNRLDSEAEGNIIDVHASRIRKKLRKAGAPIPFESRRGGVGRRAFCWILTREQKAA